MPIKIPVYGRQEQLPGSTQPFLKTPDTTKARAVQGLGKSLLDAGAKLKDERTSMEANDATSLLADQYRNFEASEKRKTGLDAVGSTERTGKFFDEQIRTITGTLSTDAARKFNPRAFSARASGMDTLSGHELVQHHERKKVVLKRHLGSARLHFAGGNFSDQDKADQIAEGARIIDEQFGGLSEKDRKLMKDSQADAITVNWIKERIKLDPSGMLNELDKYKKQIPAEEYEPLELYLKKQVQGEVARSKFLEIKALNGEDYQAMIKEAGQIGNDDLRVAVEKAVKSDYATNKTFRDAARKQEQEAVLNKVVTLWGNKNYNTARKLVVDNIGLLSPSEAERWLNNIDKMTESKIQGIEDKNNPFNVRDQSKYSVVAEWVAMNPNAITSEDIWKLHGKGLTTKDAESLDARLRKNQAKRDPLLETSYQIVKGWVKDKALGTTHAERAKNAGELMERLEQFIIDYPEKDPVDDFLVPQGKLIKKRRFDDAFSEFRKTFITQGEYGGEKITLPIKKAERSPAEFSEDNFTRDWLGADRLTNPKPVQPEMPKEKKKTKAKKISAKSIIKGALETMPVFGPFISAIPGGD